MTMNSIIKSRPRTVRDVAAIHVDGGPDLRVHVLRYDIGDHVDIRFFADGRATLRGLSFPLAYAARLAAVLQSPAIRQSETVPDPGNLQERPCEAISGDFSSDKAADMGGREKGLKGLKRRKKQKEIFEILMRAVHGDE